MMLYAGHTKPIEDKKGIYAQVEMVGQSAKQLNLVSTLDQVERIRERLLNPNLKLSPNEIGELLSALNDRISDDLARVEFGFIPSSKASYHDCLTFGERFDKRFKKLAGEVTCAGTCYAHGLNTACVFHLMRVMEAGTEYFGKRLGVKLVQVNPGKRVHELTWQDILNSINPALRSLPQTTRIQKRKYQTYSEIKIYLEAVKDAWRNPTMHPRASYDESEALNIINHVKSFMTTLSAL